MKKLALGFIGSGDVYDAKRLRSIRGVTKSLIKTNDHRRMDRQILVVFQRLISRVGQDSYGIAVCVDEAGSDIYMYITSSITDISLLLMENKKFMGVCYCLMQSAH